jgi:beta-lactam-binding protein with PASTA domain
VQIITLMPYVVGELQNVAIAQLQSLFQAVITLQYVYSGAPPLTVVDQSIPRGTLVFPGEAVTLQISLGRRHGPLPCPIVESILVSNIPVVLSILPPNKTVIH